MNAKVKCVSMDKSVNRYMEEALKEARKAAELEEVPVGAIIVKDDEIIGRGYNRTRTDADPTAHAEMTAIREAAAKLGSWRLTGCSMYVTLEPCSMCAGAIVWSRIDKLIIGAMDPKAGACGSVFNIPQEKRLNHYVEMETGIRGEECSSLLSDFFRELRESRNTDRPEETE